jgi:hypothetical protein
MCAEGVPSMLLTDPGTELNNNDVNALLNWLGVEHHTTIAKRPQAHGTERSIGKFKLHLAILVGAENARERWSDRAILPAIRLILNASHNDEINAIPLHLRYGTVAAQKYKRLTDVTQLPPATDSTTLVRDLDEALRLLQAQSDAFNQFRKNHRKQRGLPPARQHSYQQGDFILWKSDAVFLEEGPLTSQLHGPYEVQQQIGNIITAVHCANGKTYQLHHERCHIFTVDKDIATEIARQDFPTQHIIARITTHRGILSARAALSFFTIFSDDDCAWLPYSEVLDTAALQTYAATKNCTRIFLLPTKDFIDEQAKSWGTINIPQLMQAEKRIEAYSLPNVGEAVYVSYHAFDDRPFFDEGLPDIQFREYFLSAKVLKLTAKRFDINFPHLQYTVAWSLQKVAAYTKRTLTAADIHIDEDFFKMHPNLRAALMH